MVKYRINVVESERGWGQKWFHLDYDTFEEARQSIQEINSYNTDLSAPDWYMKAGETIEAVEVAE